MSSLEINYKSVTLLGHSLDLLVKKPKITRKVRHLRWSRRRPIQPRPMQSNFVSWLRLAAIQGCVRRFAWKVTYVTHHQRLI